jgi:nickel/cobalt transporter (NiCoT) family protein
MSTAAGVSLLDAIDRTFMSFAYGCALSQPVRKVYYNLTITELSLAVAVIVALEILTLLRDKFDLGPGLWGFVSKDLCDRGQSLPAPHHAARTIST